MAVDLSKPVLVVDDYNTMIRIMHNLLKQLGFGRVDDANDGSTALTKLRRGDYGLVISDWNMEPMTGFALLQEMRSDPFAGRNPVHHGHRGIEDRERHRGEGRLAYRTISSSRSTRRRSRTRSTPCSAMWKSPLPRPDCYHRNSRITALGMPPAAVNGCCQRRAVGLLAVTQLFGVNA